jgi:hypothetical protein
MEWAERQLSVYMVVQTFIQRFNRSAKSSVPYTTITLKTVHPVNEYHGTDQK